MKNCPPHEFKMEQPEEEVERCHFCGITWAEWARGFGGNTTPRKGGK